MDLVNGYSTTEYVELTKRFIDYMSDEYAVDTDRIYDTDSVTYTYAQWDGTWSTDELSSAASELFSGEATGAYFISWKTGTIDAGTGNSPMGGGDGSFGERGNGGNGGGAGGGATCHMASFDYAYNCIAVMEWLIQQ